MNEKIKSYILELLELVVTPISHIKNININYDEGKQWRVCLELENDNILLENGAEVLQAVQHIIRVMVHKKYPKDRTHFIFDCQNYRKTREHILKANIPSLVESNVVRDGKTLILIHLNSYERMQVHHMLSDLKNLETVSVGDGKARKLLVMPTGGSGTGFSSLDDSIVFDLDTELSAKIEKSNTEKSE